MSRFIYTLFLFLFSLAGYAQNGAGGTPQPVRCYSAEYLEKQYAADPSFKDSIQAENTKLEEYLLNSKNDRLEAATINIPVVFHIVYNTPEENISDTRLYEQLKVLNEDFNAGNADISNVPAAFKTHIGNAKIQFCLAGLDPQGKPTTGITRTQTTDTLFSLDDKMKLDATGGCTIWNRDKYLNIWVCKLISGVLGYTTRPGAKATVDGSVIDYRYIGLTGAQSPYNLGHSVSHEIGHWFNLIHTWGDADCGNDLVTDTPRQFGPNYGSNGNCPAFPHVTCSNGPNGDMWMNFMDYGYDHCANFFTVGQCARMNAAIATTRVKIKTSNGCVPLGIAEEISKTGFSVYPNPANDKMNVDLVLQNPENLHVTLYNIFGSVALSLSVSSYTAGGIVINTENIPDGIYFLELATGHASFKARVIIAR